MDGLLLLYDFIHIGMMMLMKTTVGYVPQFPEKHKDYNSEMKYTSRIDG